MASYSYTRDLNEEDLAKPEAHVYTKKELWENWWDYNLKWVLVGLGGLALVIFFIVDIFSTPKVDYQISIVADESVYDTTLTEISDILSPYLDDTTGDGVVTMSAYSYFVDLSSYSAVTEAAEAEGIEAEDVIIADQETDEEISATFDLTNDTSTYSYYTELAGQIQMSADLESCGTIIFILKDPQSFQLATEMLCYPDGSMPEDPLTVAWEELVYPIEECNLLSDEVKEVLSGYYIARRGSDSDSDVISQVEYYETLWNLLTEDARTYAEVLAE